MTDRVKCHLEIGKKRPRTFSRVASPNWKAGRKRTFFLPFFWGQSKKLAKSRMSRFSLWNWPIGSNLTKRATEIRDHFLISRSPFSQLFRLCVKNNHKKMCFVYKIQSPSSEKVGSLTKVEMEYALHKNQEDSNQSRKKGRAKTTTKAVTQFLPYLNRSLSRLEPFVPGS